MAEDAVDVAVLALDERHDARGRGGKNGGLRIPANRATGAGYRKLGEARCHGSLMSNCRMLRGKASRSRLGVKQAAWSIYGPAAHSGGNS